MTDVEAADPAHGSAAAPETPTPVTEGMERERVGREAGDRSTRTSSPGKDSQPASKPMAERPALAPGVELIGQMQDSAFEQQPWLALNNGRFVQLTELLYRVAEQADGKQTVDEMAAKVGESIDRSVSADNVRTLVSQKLMPLGLVPAADGSVPEAAPEGAAARSPLQINMRMRMVSQRAIEPVANALKILYWPPVLIALLVAAFLGQGWLYFVHGLAQGTRSAIYHPGYLLAILGIIIVGTVVHELGHAAALQYGGGHVRGMGMGMYLVYPAFYTDVTENYRLPRWSKVRTDLGGFYFNLIFGLLVIGVWALTRQDFLLLVVVLIDIEIIHQLIPFVRLDGYWTLADITGMPDFLSQMVPFLRASLPFLHEKDSKLPSLKRWVRVVFSLYILITAPLLAFLLFMMIKSVPRVLASAWDSAARLGHTFSVAQGHGDTLGMAAAVVQIVVLALPTGGLLYVLVKLARGVFTAIWRWSRPTAGRRVVGGLGSLGIVGLLAFLWLPQLPFAPGGVHGPFYGDTSFTPIGANDTGTVQNAWRPAGGDPSRPGRRGSTTPAVHGTATPGVKAAAAKTATATARKRAGAAHPTARPTLQPTATVAATVAATAPPTVAPTVAPTLAPTVAPTPAPTIAPTPIP